MSESNYSKFQKKGICPHCKKETLDINEKLCPECLNIYYVNNIKYREEHPDKIKESVRKHNKKRYSRNVANGICTRCGKRKAFIGKTQCSICLEEQRKYHIRAGKSQKNKYQELKEKGICTRCKKNKAMYKKTICTECSEKLKAYRLKTNGLVNQNTKIVW